MAFDHDVFATHLINEHICMFFFERFLFRMLAALHSDEYVIEFLSYLNEAQHWSVLVERRWHRERV